MKRYNDTSAVNLEKMEERLADDVLSGKIAISDYVVKRGGVANTRPPWLSFMLAPLLHLIFDKHRPGKIGDK